MNNEDFKINNCIIGHNNYKEALETMLEVFKVEGNEEVPSIQTTCDFLEENTLGLSKAVIYVMASMIVAQELGDNIKNTTEEQLKQKIADTLYIATSLACPINKQSQIQENKEKKQPNIYIRSNKFGCA